MQWSVETKQGPVTLGREEEAICPVEVMHRARELALGGPFTVRRLDCIPCDGSGMKKRWSVIFSFGPKGKCRCCGGMGLARHCPCGSQSVRDRNKAGRPAKASTGERHGP